MITASSSRSVGQLHVGAASASIVPDGTVLVAGQLYRRVSEGVETPLLASVIALETRDGGRSIDHAIFVACDLVVIGDQVCEVVRSLVAERVPEVDPAKVVINATHTHTAPQVSDPADGLGGAEISPQEYRRFLAEQIVMAIDVAWQTRRPGSAAWGLGHAVLGLNRRAVYADGSSEMYGKVHTDDFRGIEGYEDHGVEVLSFWDADDVLVATVINVACPSQEVEHNMSLDADFWHEVRAALLADHGEDLTVLGWVGAAGDQSPHLMLRASAEERMRQMRGLTRKQELARRLLAGWREAQLGAQQERHSTVELSHRAWEAQLPVRLVTEEERDAAQAEIDRLSRDPEGGTRARWHQDVVTRYAQQSSEDTHRSEIHVVRLGEVVITSNEFELFTDYGMQLKGRSPALQTFVIQLANGQGSYLPTERAVAGGGYSAIIQSNTVGPTGGQQLVEETLAVINSLWQNPVDINNEGAGK